MKKKLIIQIYSSDITSLIRASAIFILSIFKFSVMNTSDNSWSMLERFSASLIKLVENKIKINEINLNNYQITIPFIYKWAKTLTEHFWI